MREMNFMAVRAPYVCSPVPVSSMMEAPPESQTVFRLDGAHESIGSVFVTHVKQQERSKEKGDTVEWLGGH